MAARRPPLVQKVRDQHPEQTVEVWFRDEARFGQKGSRTRVWARRGSRPTRRKPTEYDWVYAYGAANPLSGDSLAGLMPTVNTGLMSLYLEHRGRHVGPARHIVRVLDQAGWHVAKDLQVPVNITLRFLPPYSPELNPIERVWCFLKEPHLSNRVYAAYAAYVAYVAYAALLAAGSAAGNALTPQRIRSICKTGWIERKE